MRIMHLTAQSVLQRYLVPAYLGGLYEKHDKLFGIIVMVAVIGFSFTACGDGGGGTAAWRFHVLLNIKMNLPRWSQIVTTFKNCKR
jgi:hypothetical protein